MRQFSIIILLFSLILNCQHVYATLKGGINYSIPIDYSKLSETELADKAKKHYLNAQSATNKTITKDITNALFIYSILEEINPQQLEYPIKLGILYDKLEKDRQAKGCFSRAIAIKSTSPEAYFYFAEFYYKRQAYRKALHYFNLAYKNGYADNYDTLYYLGDIYEKFGDTESAIKFLEKAQEKNPNTKLENKIKKIKIQHATNKEFYSKSKRLK